MKEGFYKKLQHAKDFVTYTALASLGGGKPITTSSRTTERRLRWERRIFCESRPCYQCAKTWPDFETQFISAARMPSLLKMPHFYELSGECKGDPLTFGFIVGSLASTKAAQTESSYNF